MREELKSADTAELLALCDNGDKQALDEVFERVYRELHSMAHQLRRGAQDTMGTTGLIHEAYLKLGNAASLSINSRKHFCRTAAKAMRQILINAAQTRQAKKRGEGQHPESLIEEIVGSYQDQQQIIDVGRALEALRDLDARMADIVELRYFGGYSSNECADMLDLSVPTVQRDWRLARAWLAQALSEQHQIPADPAD